jgi:hypothetical protein
MLVGFDGALSCHLEAVRAPTRRDAFSGRVLVLQMDHGRQTEDGASLAGAGVEAVQTCSEGSPTSYYGYASCPSRCGCCLLRSIQIGTLGGSTVYHILSSSTLLQSLTLSCRDLSTRILLLTRSRPDILPIHCRSSATSEAKWSMRCKFRRWLSTLLRHFGGPPYRL